MAIDRSSRSLPFSHPHLSGVALLVSRSGRGFTDGQFAHLLGPMYLRVSQCTSHTVVPVAAVRSHFSPDNFHFFSLPLQAVLRTRSVDYCPLMTISKFFPSHLSCPGQEIVR